MNVRVIREMAAANTVEELEAMARAMLAARQEEILSEPHVADRFNSIVKAKAVRRAIDDGMSTREAIRELGRMMRNVVGYDREE